MQPGSKTSARRGIGVLLAFAAGSMIGVLGVSPAFASERMPVAQQNALVQKYCAVCHTDTARNGGLSLEHFDAAQAAPSLAAMMVSKLTSGVALEIVKRAASDPDAAAFVARKMKSGAMGAAGIPIPDQATIDALISALASETTGANDWNVSRTHDTAMKAPVLTASILRELPSANPGEAAMFRLVLACNTATHEGEMQLAWAPLPQRGTLSAVVDGKNPITYRVDGTETMGNGSPATTGPAAISLYEPKKEPHPPRVLLPAHSLRIENLFPDEPVEFPFGDLPKTARESLAVCFQ
jgi:hypothetical protein